jgi:hypothetical protein
MRPIIVLSAVLTLGAASAQSVISSANSDEPVRLILSDAAVLDSQEPRNELTCAVEPSKPELGFDFMFHSGYHVRIRRKELSAKNTFTIVLRVLSENRKDQPVYFVQKFNSSAITIDNFTGEGILSGVFRVGEGRYHVDWLMRDENERVCARFWDVDARAIGKDNPLAEGLAHNVIQRVESTLFYEETPVERMPSGRPLHVKVIVNFAPQRTDAVTLEHDDLQGLVAILRKIEREPRIGRFSIVACSVQTQQIIYQQQNVSHIDLPALGVALKQLNLGKVDAKQLVSKHGETEFLGKLIAEEPGDQPDGLIFVSPKFALDANISPEAIWRAKDLDRSVFYLNYSLNSSLYPWRDAIGRFVKQLHGFEYTISRPRDLFNAWPNVVSHLLSAKGYSQTGNVSQ